jgi:hypothetical protein
MHQRNGRAERLFWHLLYRRNSRRDVVKKLLKICGLFSIVATLLRPVPDPLEAILGHTVGYKKACLSQRNIWISERPFAKERAQQIHSRTRRPDLSRRGLSRPSRPQHSKSLPLFNWVKRKYDLYGLPPQRCLVAVQPLKHPVSSLASRKRALLKARVLRAALALAA